MILFAENGVMADADRAPPNPSEVAKPALFGRELAVRAASAIVMLALAGGALWLGGWWWNGFVAALACGVLWEWNRLVSKFGIKPLVEVLWLFVGVIYVVGAALYMADLRERYVPLFMLVGFVLPIIAVDVGAYFAGRTIGGPKIAPAISPSKTWAGLFGGIAAVFLVACGIIYGFPASGHFGPPSASGPQPINFIASLIAAVFIAVTAQAGDFFESWMKRRAGVKDSSGLIPGHGGLFDRLDGFLAVFFVLFVVDALGKLLG